MERQIRCFGCGRVVGTKYSDFKHHVDSGVSESDALTEIGLERNCCRTAVLTSTDVSEKVLAAGRPEYEEVTGRTVIKDVGLYPERKIKYGNKVEYPADIHAAVSGPAEFQIYEGFILAEAREVPEAQEEPFEHLPTARPDTPVEVFNKSRTPMRDPEAIARRELPDTIALLGEGSQHWQALGWRLGESFEGAELTEDQTPQLPEVFTKPLEPGNLGVEESFELFVEVVPRSNVVFIVRWSNLETPLTGDDLFNGVNLYFQRPIRSDRINQLLSDTIMQAAWYIYDIRRLQEMGIELTNASMRLGYLRFAKFKRMPGSKRIFLEMEPFKKPEIITTEGATNFSGRSVDEADTTPTNQDVHTRQINSERGLAPTFNNENTLDYISINIPRSRQRLVDAAVGKLGGATITKHDNRFINFSNKRSIVIPEILGETINLSPYTTLDGNPRSRGINLVGMNMRNAWYDRGLILICRREEGPPVVVIFNTEVSVGEFEFSYF